MPEFPSKLLDHSNPYAPFLPLLSYSSNPEEPIPLLTSSVLSSLIMGAQTKQQNSIQKTYEALPKLYKYLSGLTKSQDSGLQDIAVQEYSAVLRTKTARQLFWKQRKETVDPLTDILRAAAGASKDGDSTLYSSATSIRGDGGIAGGIGIQLLYHVLLVVWQLSYEGESIGKQLAEYAYILLEPSNS